MIIFYTVVIKDY